MKKNSCFTNYTVGEDAYREIPNICKKYGQKVVIIGGEKSREVTEPTIVRILKENGFEMIGSFWYGGEAAFENAKFLEEKEEIKNTDIIFAIGGGKVMDTCKVISERMEKPLFTFPTIASTCAAMTSVAVIYNLDGSYRDLFWKTTPHEHCFIDTKIIAEAPEIYLWAGIGDTLAKAYEPEFSARGREVDYNNSVGLALSSLCKTTLLKYGKQAMRDCKFGINSKEFEEVVLTNIVTTGIVSNHLINDYNSCIAHAICYGFSTIEEVEKNHLHGELVSYGILVQLVIDKKLKELRELLNFYREIGLPTSYRYFGVEKKDLIKVALFAAQVEDMKIVPFEIDAQQILDGMNELESILHHI
jgi:glycerol dehydrogenase